MGNTTSSEDNPNGMGIKFDKKELKVLYKNFLKLDSDNSGLLEPKEFFSVEELKDNPIVHRIISVFDKNNDGKISFYEFISGLSILTEVGMLIFFKILIIFSNN
jgi:serine/threonine-protein phosphatase 2B regulatory subunit